MFLCSYIWSYNEIEWDEAKNHTNIRKHGFDFADAEAVFAGILLVQPDIAEDYGEDRWIGLGIIREATVAVVFTCVNLKPFASSL
jgi:uncharacterized protein